MIDLHPSDPVLVVAVTVSLGFLLLLFSLLVPEEPTIQLASLLPKIPSVAKQDAPQTTQEEPVPSTTSVPRFVHAVNQAVIAQETAEREKVANSPVPPAPNFAPVTAAQPPIPTPPIPPQPIIQPPIAPPRFEWPTTAPEEPTVIPPRQTRLEVQQARNERRESRSEQRFQPTVVPSRTTSEDRGRRITWTSLVDESAEELDLPTRLKIIEALGLVGGSWSREILARAYEQEMDAQVRGAIFLALRDSKSAA